MTLRTSLFNEFVCSQISDPPARVLEIGCGSGELARALADSGFEVTAIDPNAPEGAIFCRTALEDFSDERGFDAVVASVSLHHIHDLPGAVERIASLLPRSGVLVLEEFAKENLVGRTAFWYHEQRRALTRAGSIDSAVPDDFIVWQSQTRAAHADIHTASATLAALEVRFAKRFFQRTPYLFSWRLDDALEPLERRLIAEGTIEATGVWYVGERR